MSPAANPVLSLNTGLTATNRRGFVGTLAYTLTDALPDISGGLQASLEGDKRSVVVGGEPVGVEGEIPPPWRGVTLSWSRVAFVEKKKYLEPMASIAFLLASIYHLGPRLGLRYWRIYRRALKDPALIIRWENKCRWESAQVESSDPTASKFFDEWAVVLSRCPGGSRANSESRESGTPAP
jgi:hypothetical protein